MISPGEAAPQFTATDHRRNIVSLGDFLGRDLVLWFYPMADTPGCTAEACGFRDLSAEFAAKNAAIVGVSFDAVEANAAFADKFALSFPLLCDTNREMGLAYGAAETADQPMARRIAVLIGPDGVVRESWAKVSAATFPDEVLALL